MDSVTIYICRYMRYEYCDIPICSNITKLPAKRLECRYDRRGIEYIGTISHTHTGRTCQLWNSQFPRWHLDIGITDAEFADGLLFARNHCRNPDKKVNGPWCYTEDNKAGDWEYCQIPLCEMQHESKYSNLDFNLNYKTVTKTHLCVVTESMVLIFHPIIVIIGTFSNALSISVFTRRSLWHSNTPYMLTILAISDIIALYIKPLNAWLKLVIGSPLTASSGASCMIYAYLESIAACLPAWLLILITADRIIAVAWPMKVNHICTRKNLNMSMLTLVVIICLIFVPILFQIELHHVIMFNTNETQFTIYSSCYLQSSSIALWVNMIFNTIASNSLILLESVILTILLILLHIKRQSMNVNSNIQVKFMASLLISTCFIYIFLTLPSLLRHRFFSQPFLRLFDITSIDQYHCVQKLWLECSIICTCINHSIHFFIYCFSGEKFKKEFRAMCNCKCMPFSQPANYRHHQASNSNGNFMHKLSKSNNTLQPIS